MHEEVCNVLTSSFQIRNHIIRYAVIASVYAIMIREDSCFNLTSKLTACHMTSYLASFCMHYKLYCSSDYQHY